MRHLVFIEDGSADIGTVHLGETRISDVITPNVRSQSLKGYEAQRWIECGALYDIFECENCIYFPGMGLDDVATIAKNIYDYSVQKISKITGKYKK